MYADLIIFLVLLTIGYIFGRLAENKHYRSIHRREEEFAKLLIFSERSTPEHIPIKQQHLVSGNVVVSVDYFKRFLAWLRNLIGGRVISYESLLDRARREAILRMKAQARTLECNMIFNVKIETSSISKGKKDSLGSIEIIAYGTALEIA